MKERRKEREKGSKLWNASRNPWAICAVTQGCTVYAFLLARLPTKRQETLPRVLNMTHSFAQFPLLRQENDLGCCCDIRPLCRSYWVRFLFRGRCHNEKEKRKKKGTAKLQNLQKVNKLLGFSYCTSDGKMEKIRKVGRERHQRDWEEEEEFVVQKRGSWNEEDQDSGKNQHSSIRSYTSPSLPLPYRPHPSNLHTKFSSTLIPHGAPKSPESIPL